MSLVVKHAWLAFIVITCANAAIWRSRSKPEIARDPSLAEGYERLINGLLFYGNLPWLVMGAGILAGGVPSVLSFLDPRNGPFVLAWYVTAIALWLAAAHWIFSRGGAETLVRHPGLTNHSIQDPRLVKAFVLLSLVAAILGELAQFIGAGHAPK